MRRFLAREWEWEWCWSEWETEADIPTCEGVVPGSSVPGTWCVDKLVLSPPLLGCAADDAGLCS